MIGGERRSRPLTPWERSDEGAEPVARVPRGSAAVALPASPGDSLIITWALGTDASGRLRYNGLVSGVDTTEVSRDVGSALELTGQGFDPDGNSSSPDTE